MIIISKRNFNTKNFRIIKKTIILKIFKKFLIKYMQDTLKKTFITNYKQP